MMVSFPVLIDVCFAVLWVCVGLGRLDFVVCVLGVVTLVAVMDEFLDEENVGVTTRG